MKTILNSGFLIFFLTLIFSASTMLRSAPDDFMGSCVVITYTDSQENNEPGKGYLIAPVNECMPASRLNNEIFINRL